MKHDNFLLVLKLSRGCMIYARYFFDLCESYQEVARSKRGILLAYAKVIKRLHDLTYFSLSYYASSRSFLLYICIQLSSSFSSFYVKWYSFPCSLYSLCKIININKPKVCNLLHIMYEWSKFSKFFYLDYSSYIFEVCKDTYFVHVGKQIIYASE